MSLKIQLGLFALNSSSGITMTKHPKRWNAKIDDIIKITKLCDGNFDFIFNVQRWLGFGGKTDPAKTTYDSISLTSSMLSVTKKIKVFFTVHPILLHPTFVARSYATIDQISKGRTGINIVCGWNQDEFKMFGQKELLKIDKFKYAENWLGIFKKILIGKSVTFKNSNLKAIKSVCNPNSYKIRNPLVLSAAYSKIGQKFSLKNSNIFFTMFSDLEVLKRNIFKIKKKNKKIKIYGLAHVVCERNDLLAKKKYELYANKYADTQAINNFLNIYSDSSKNKLAKHMNKNLKIKMAGGIGSYPIIGSYKNVYNHLKKIEKTGLDGIALSFLDYNKDVLFFIKKVINN